MSWSRFGILGFIPLGFLDILLLIPGYTFAQARRVWIIGQILGLTRLSPVTKAAYPKTIFFVLYGEVIAAQALQC